MSLENISSFYLKSVKSELEFKRHHSKNKYLPTNKKVQKVNPKLKLPPIEKVTSIPNLIQKLDSEDHIVEVKENLKHLQKLFDEETNLDLESCESRSKCETEFLTNRDDIRSELDDTISIASAVDDIISLEEKLKSSFLELEQTRQERLKEQNAICSKIQELQKCPFAKRNSQKFLKICNYKDPQSKYKSITKPRFIAKPAKVLKVDRRHKSQDKSINTQLPKSKMSTLTDEQKARIQELLADIDDNGEDIDLVETNDSETDIEYFPKAFVFNEHEKTKIGEIHEKLEEFEETQEKRDVLSNFEDVKYDQIDWKELKKLSLDEIDKALKYLKTTERSKKIEETIKPVEKINFEGTINDDDTIKLDEPIKPEERNQSDETT